MKCPCGKECSLMEELIEYKRESTGKESFFIILIMGRYVEKCPNQNGLWHCDKKKIDKELKDWGY